MSETLFFIIGLFVGYNLGQAILAWRIKDVIIKEARREGLYIDDEYNIIESKDQKTDVAQLFIERANNILYLYEKDAGTFICQADTIEELARLAKEYKHIKYAAVMDEYNSDVFAFVDGKVKTDILVKKQ